MLVILAINLMVEKGGLTAFDRFYCRTLNPLKLAFGLRILKLLIRPIQEQMYESFGYKHDLGKILIDPIFKSRRLKINSPVDFVH